MNKSKFVLIFEADDKLASALEQALKPDDKNPPPGIKIYSRRLGKKKGSILVYTILSEYKDILTLRNTVDDILEKIELVLETFKNIQEKK